MKPLRLTFELVHGQGYRDEHDDVEGTLGGSGDVMHDRRLSYQSMWKVVTVWIVLGVLCLPCKASMAILCLVTPYKQLSSLHDIQFG